MTTAAMVLGVRAADHRERRRRGVALLMGLVIVAGLSIGTLFTLFVVPAVYMLIGAEHHHAAEEGTAQIPAPQEH